MAEQKAKRRKKAWSASEGPYGARVRVFQDPKSRKIYGEMRDASVPCGYRCVSLKHDDRDRAVKWAKEQVAQLERGAFEARSQVPTVSRVLALYLKHQSPLKVKSEQKADERRAKLWTRVLNATKDLSKLSLKEWNAFVEARKTGAINAQGEPVALDDRESVRAATTAADLIFLISVVNWAVKWRLDDERYLMHENPARGYPVPTEKNPRRPVVSEERFQKVRAVAGQVTMVVGRGENRRVVPCYLPEILDLANGTGRRISAILALRRRDVKLNVGPCGSICWPADTDKMKREWTVPISPAVRAAIDRILTERANEEDDFLFPGIKDASKPVGIELAASWLLEAEGIAKVEKQTGSLFHAYRRKWATDRKGMPTADVAAAGGWSDQNTLLTVYQQPDQDTMYRVVAEPSRV
jgi:integrase